MIKPLGNSMLCEAVDIEDTNIDLGRKFGDKQGWRVVEFGLKFEYREPITKDDILLIGGEEEYNLIDNGRHVCKFHPNQIVGIIRKDIKKD